MPLDQYKVQGAPLLLSMSTRSQYRWVNGIMWMGDQPSGQVQRLVMLTSPTGNATFLSMQTLWVLLGHSSSVTYQQEENHYIFSSQPRADQNFVPLLSVKCSD